MDIIKRNFFRLLRSGALNEYEALEPMSPFKWRRLLQMVQAQQVTEIAQRGLRNHQYDANFDIPQECVDELMNKNLHEERKTARLSNHFLNKKLRRIREQEPHAIDASMDTLAFLNIIIQNTSDMLNQGLSLRGIMEMGRFLRTKGDKVDFVKLEDWLHQLHLNDMAQLQGSMLIESFAFDKNEVPFVQYVQPAAKRIIKRSINHTAIDTAKEWHFRQTKAGFVRNNSTVLRRNLRRSIRYINYAPIETASNFINNFARSLSEIEE